MSSNRLLKTACLLAVLAAAASCGGGGGGSDGRVIFEGTGFGFFDRFGNTTSPPTSDDFPTVWGVNLAVILYFNEAIDPATCNNLSINLVTMEDPLGQAGYGGGLSAAVDFLVVNETQLWLKPRIFFSPTEVSFGFLPDALYEIKFQTAPSEHVVRSVSGRTITLPSSSNPTAFRTPAIDDPGGYIYDEYAGPPHPLRFTLFDVQGTASAYYDNDPDSPEYQQWIDAASGQAMAEVPVADPVHPPRVRIDFSEPVDPLSVVSVADKSSPSCDVFYYDQGPWDPVAALGSWVLTQRVTETGDIESYVEYTCELLMLKPSPPPPADPIQYFVRVKGTVDDLAGNRKGYMNWDEIHFVTDESAATLPVLVEEFDDTAYEDSSGTSAFWGVASPGAGNILRPGSGGGTGADGEFLPPAALPADADVDLDKMTVELPTESAGAVRVYEFSDFTLPSGWTLHPFDSGLGFPLVIRSTGNVTIIGTIDVSTLHPTGGYNEQDGQNGPHDVLDGTIGGRGATGGAPGGDGGSLRIGGTAAFRDTEGYLDPSGTSGITGKNSEIFDYALRDSAKPAEFFTTVDTQLQAGVKMYLQPNVGMGPGNDIVVANHPTFLLSGVDAINKEFQITEERGSMLGPSGNPGIPIPPITKTGDPYLIANLGGLDGQDVLPFNRQGRGSEPMSVAQTAYTLAAAGGGGGGGSLEAGADGETGPDFEPLGGTLGGFSTPDSLGGAGGAGLDVMGPCSKNDNVTLFVGGATLDPAIDYTGYRVSPNSLEEGWLFSIADADSVAGTITIEPFSNGLSDALFDLDSVAFDGDEIFRLIPPENAGGAGGGGSGAELTGTSKTFPSQIPTWVVGAGGGAGGGVLRIETARSITLSPSGVILARGGDGGSILGSTVTVPGGGGGGGGQILLRARDSIKASPTAIISVEGGVGGGFIAGGQGGSGFVRLENSLGNLKVGNFLSPIRPTPTEMNLGIYAAQEGATLATSKFYFMGISRPDYIYDPDNVDPDLRGLKVVYDMRETVEGGGDTEYEDLVYPDPNGQFPDPPLFSIDFNAAPADDDGFLDLGAVNQDFYDYDSFDLLDGVPYIRFKMLLQSSVDTDVGGVIYTYTGLKIKSITIMRVQL